MRAVEEPRCRFSDYQTKLFDELRLALKLDCGRTREERRDDAEGLRDSPINKGKLDSFKTPDSS